MRMWNINPELMCNQHLLGEHVEMHMFVGCINKKKNIKGYLEKGLLEMHNLRKRHEELVKEMKKRKMNHKSKLPYFKSEKSGKVEVKKNMKELRRRCKNCKKLIKLKKK